MILRDFLPPHTTARQFQETDLKQYRHFDAVTSLVKAEEIIAKLERGERHSYMPLLRYTEEWRRAPKKVRILLNGKVVSQIRERTPKKRPISYCSHKDAIALKYLREILSPIFDESLREDDLENNVIAYRKIPKANGHGNKSNIDFAKDAMSTIAKLDDCCAIAVDIEDYFGSINHAKLKVRLLQLIGTHQLPRDLSQAFKNVTSYKYVLLDDAMVALGYSEFRKGQLKYKIKKSIIPRQLCTKEQYREIICKSNIIFKHDTGIGIPQGTPISDIFANIYLREVDLELRKYALERGGTYLRYSDDILLILPGDGRTANHAEKYACKSLLDFDENLKLGAAKTEIAIFKKGVCAYTLHPVENSRRKARGPGSLGFSYLGFRYDGRKTYLRESTIANLRRKIVKRCHVITSKYIKRYSKKDEAWLLANAPIDEAKQLYLKMRFGKDGTKFVPSRKAFIKESAIAAQQSKQEKKDRNFHTYVAKAEKEFAQFDPQFKKQLKRIPLLIEHTINQAIIDR